MNANKRTMCQAGAVLLLAAGFLARPAGAAPDVDSAGQAALTVSGETRLRFDTYRNAQLQDGKDYEQALFRGLLGADFRVSPMLRLHGELGTGQLRGQGGTASANFQNALSVQQAFVEARNTFDGATAGVVIGRQEFSDGPRQLISLSDGPNLHRSWNGLRLYSQWERVHVGAFAFRITRLGRGSFDEEVNRGERLHGINASIPLEFGNAASSVLELFWYATGNRQFRLAGRVGEDQRDTVGMRWWGQEGPWRFDWTAARQTGNSLQREVDAWGLFAVQSVAVANDGWKPRLLLRIDAASGGGASGSHTVRAFNPLYGSSSYLGEGQFLGLSNLLMVTPGISLSPGARFNFSVEYGIARRLASDDPAFAGGLRPYPGTQQAGGRDLGRLARLLGTWSVNPRLTLIVDYEDFHPGPVLARAGLTRGRYFYTAATYKF